MEKFNKNINIDFDGKELYLATDSSSGSLYYPKDKLELCECIVCYVMDVIDEELEYKFKVWRDK